MLIEIELPVAPPRTGVAFLELSRRRGDFALMGVAAVVGLAADGTCTHARLAYCGAGDKPMLARDAAQALIGRRIGGIRPRASRGAGTKRDRPARQRARQQGLSAPSRGRAHPAGFATRPSARSVH